MRCNDCGDGPRRPRVFDRPCRPDARAAKVPMLQLAAWAGWSRDALCDERRLGDPAVRKALRAPFPPGFLQAIAHLQHPALRHALYRKISG